MHLSTLTAFPPLVVGGLQRIESVNETRVYRLFRIDQWAADACEIFIRSATTAQPYHVYLVTSERHVRTWRGIMMPSNTPSGITLYTDNSYVYLEVAAWKGGHVRLVGSSSGNMFTCQQVSVDTSSLTVVAVN